MGTTVMDYVVYIAASITCFTLQFSFQRLSTNIISKPVSVQYWQCVCLCVCVSWLDPCPSTTPPLPAERLEVL